MCAQVPAVAAVLALLYGVHAWLRARARVFLLDFACYKPPENLKVNLEDFMKGSRDTAVTPLGWLLLDSPAWLALHNQCFSGIADLYRHPCMLVACSCCRSPYLAAGTCPAELLKQQGPALVSLAGSVLTQAE